MTTRTELMHRLEAVAAEPVGAASPAFVEELEARLVDDLTATPVALHAVDEAPATAAPRRPRVRAVAVAAAVVVVVGLVLASLQHAPTRLATPFGPASPSTDTDSGEEEGAPEGDDRNSDEVRSGDEASPSDGGGGPAGDESAPDDDKRSAYAERTEQEDEARPPFAEGRYGEPSEERFVLEAQPTPTGADLTWEPFDGDDFFAYLVMRAQGEDPSYPRDEDHKTTFVHKSSDRDATTWSDTNPGVTDDTRYMVVVFDRTGRELARSNVAAVGASVGISIMLPTP